MRPLAHSIFSRLPQIFFNAPTDGSGGVPSIDAIKAILETPAEPVAEPSLETPADEPVAADEPDPDEPPSEPAPEPTADDWRAQLSPEAAAHIAALEAAAAKPAEPAPVAPVSKPAPTTLAEISTPEELTAFEERTENLRDWAFQNRDGATLTDADGNETHYTADQMAMIFTAQDKLLRKGIPAHFAELENRASSAANRERVVAFAAAQYPWVNQPETPHGKKYAEVANALPELAAMEGGPIAIADLVAGFMARTARAKVQTPAPVAKPAARPPVVPAGGGGGGGGKFDPTDALARFTASGGKDRSAAVSAIESLLT